MMWTLPGRYHGNLSHLYHSSCIKVKVIFIVLKGQLVAQPAVDEYNKQHKPTYTPTNYTKKDKKLHNTAQKANGSRHEWVFKSIGPESSQNICVTRWKQLVLVEQEATTVSQDRLDLCDLVAAISLHILTIPSNLFLFIRVSDPKPADKRKS